MSDFSPYVSPVTHLRSDNTLLFLLLPFCVALSVPPVLLIPFLFLLSLSYFLLPLSVPLYLGCSSFLVFKQYALVLSDLTPSFEKAYKDLHLPFE